MNNLDFKSNIWKEETEITVIIDAMASDLLDLIAQRMIDHPLMIGIHTGGAWIANFLHARLQLDDQLGYLDISFYRDDFTQVGLHPQVRPSELPVDINNRHVILIDDVLQTGRTVRAALNVLFDYGRPASVILATLVERTDRELPIAPDVVGLHVNFKREEQIKLSGPNPLKLLRGKLRPQTNLSR